MPPPARPARPWDTTLRVSALALVAVLLGACRIAVVAIVDIDDLGAGRLVVRVEVDREAADQLTATGVQLVPEAQPGWTVDSVEAGDVVQVSLATTFADPAGLAARVEALRAGLDDEDPRLLEAIDLDVVDGAITLHASAGLELPSSAGADIQGWPTEDELLALALANDVSASLAVTAPGPIVTAEGAPAVVDGATVEFDLPVGDTAQLAVTSRRATLWDTPWWTVAAALAGVLLVVLGTTAMVRRRRARRDAPLGRIRGMGGR